MTTATLVVAGFIALAAAAVLDVVLTGRDRTFVRQAPYAVIAAACVLLAVAGFRADLGHTGTISLGDAFSIERSQLLLDPLSGLFLAVVGVVAAPVALAFMGWCRTPTDVPYRGLAAAAALTVASVALIVLADDAFVFLFGWEGLSGAFYLLAGYRRERPTAARDSTLTFSFSKASGTLLLLAFMVLYGATGSLRLADWHGAASGARTAAYALALAAFAIKVGLVPVQVWMPAGYGAAPGPARALMSAVAANAGFYGMWRMLASLGPPPQWIAIVFVTLAAITALLGAAHAAVQRDLQRVIAYSSIENGGLISAGYAIALAGAAVREDRLIALGLLTGSLQMVAHAFGKSALFLASARLEQRTGSRDLDVVRGVGAFEPLAGTVFSVGAFTLAALPLTVGFVSEWYLLEAIMQLFRLSSQTLQMALAVAGALLALAIGFASLVFVRLVGLTVLGRASDRDPAWIGHPRPASLGAAGRIGLLLPILGCVGVAAAAPWEIRFIAHGLSPIAPASTTSGALASPWVLQPVYARFSALSPSWLAVEMPILAALVVVATTVLTRGSFLRVRRVPPWRSGTGGVAGDARYTPSAFAEPARHVLGSVLLPHQTVTALVAQPSQRGEDASVFPGPALPGSDEQPPDRELRPVGALEGAEQQRIAYDSDVVELVERYLYRPLIAPIGALVLAAKRLQSGRLDAYIGYLLVTLVILLAVVAGLS